MAFLEESGDWTGVYRIEKDDDVLGATQNGIGPSNKPHLDLADRTRHLKNKIGTVTEER